MSMHKKANLVGTIESLLKAVGAEAIDKRAEANTEAGGYMGGTTHPVKDVDDRTEDAQEGARSAENTEDAKTEPNRGKPVDSVTPGPGAGQESVQTDIGITSKATGDDPSAETDSAKDGKQDPGSSHPARTDNDELDGHKYASQHELLAALCKKAEKLGESMCSWIATNADNSKQAPVKTAGNKKADESAAGNTNSEAGGKGVKDGPITKPGKVEAGGSAASSTCSDKIGQAAYDLAGIFANLDVTTEDKVAADRMVVDTVGQVIETALRRAEKCAMFYTAHFDPRNQKAAEGDEGHEGKSEGSEDKNRDDEHSEAGGGAPAQDASAGGAGPTPEEEALLSQLLAGGNQMPAGDAMQGMGGGGEAEGGGDAAMGGGGMPGGMGGEIGGGAGAGGGDPMQGMGGDPMQAMGGGAGGGDPMAAMGGGMPPGGAGGGAGGGMGGQIDPAMLQQILAELGISPQEVQSKISAAKKQASHSASKKRAVWQPKTAADREKYARMKQVITEITGRSRK